MDIQIDYARRLAALSGNVFQDEIETLLLQRIRTFQAVPANPGDGGLDGLSDDCSVAYCCYGLDLTKGSTSNKALAQAIQTKFVDDLRKLFELNLIIPPGKKKATLLAHKDNKTARAILNGKKIAHVHLCVNWYEDPAIFGYIGGKIAEMKAKSQLVLVEATLTFALLGPKEIARKFDAGADGI